jgi:hypothetical protein
MIKIINKRKGGGLFHYAHFLCDCLFPEIINNIYNYKTVIREKNIDQTLGNFNKIYEEVMLNKSIELIKSQFDILYIKTITYHPKEYYCNKKYFDIFRQFIFKRYKINPFVYIDTYSPIILIKRYNRINLINDNYLKDLNTNVTTGKERREIDKIDSLEEYLKNKYNGKIKSVYLELMSFEEQIKIFNNAKIIICAHGAAMSNMFFCKEQTTIIEVTCNMNWDFFNNMSIHLNLKHIKCFDNNLNSVIKCIEENVITELNNNHGNL